MEQKIIRASYLGTSISLAVTAKYPLEDADGLQVLQAVMDSRLSPGGGRVEGLQRECWRKLLELGRARLAAK